MNVKTLKECLDGLDPNMPVYIVSYDFKDLPLESVMIDQDVGVLLYTMDEFDDDSSL